MSRDVCWRVVRKCWPDGRGVRTQWWRLRQEWRRRSLLHRMWWLGVLHGLGAARRGEIDSCVGDNHARLGWRIGSSGVGLG